MNDVEPHVAGSADPHDRVEVGAVVVKRRANVMHGLCDLFDVALEQPQRRGVCQHQARHIGVDVTAQIIDVNVPVLVSTDFDELVAGHRHSRGIGAVGRVRCEHLGAPVPVGFVVRTRDQNPGELAVRAGTGL